MNKMRKKIYFSSIMKKIKTINFLYIFFQLYFLEIILVGLRSNLDLSW